MEADKIFIQKLFTNIREKDSYFCKVSEYLQLNYYSDRYSACKSCPFSTDDVNCFHDINFLNIKKIKELLIKKFPSLLLEEKS